MYPRIMSAATALPPYRVTREEAWAALRPIFPDLPDRYFRRFIQNSGVQDRYSCLPSNDVLKERTAGAKNDLYIEHAVPLGAKAARRALDRADVDPSEVGALFGCSITGEMHPPLTTVLAPEIGLLDEHTELEMDTANGCAAGADALARAERWCRDNPESHALVVAVEICSATVQVQDKSRTNLLAGSLFGDGSGAVVMSCKGEGPEIIGKDCVLWSDHADAMGWRHDENGRSLILHPKVPELARQHLRASIERSARYLGLDPEDLKHYIIHPGSTGILDALEDTSRMDRGELVDSREVLRDYGNMSSVTVIGVLANWLQRDHQDGELGLISAMGPGFRARHVFIRTGGQ